MIINIYTYIRKIDRLKVPLFNKIVIIYVCIYFLPFDSMEAVEDAVKRWPTL